jgi:Mlc titration factor MtfA (ptsG expression regulator)
MVVDDYMRAVIASQACLLILELDLDYYDGWIEIVVYPDSFIVTREVRDEIGVIHMKRSVLGGEAWGRGPLILSWKDAQPVTHQHGRGFHRQGSNVILHEFAHKLDMFDGSADGTPLLHPDMRLQDWVKTFTAAYDHLRQDIERNIQTSIDPYAAENPAEFFAVVTEEFFEVPEHLHRHYPDIYQQLRLFYRQDPLQRHIKSYKV